MRALIGLALGAACSGLACSQSWSQAGTAAAGSAALPSALSLSVAAGRVEPKVLPSYASSASSTATQAPAANRPPAAISPEQQLGAIREALLQTTLSAPTQVKSVSWINEQGQLHESSQFTTDVKLRGVQVVDMSRPDEPAGTQVQARVETETGGQKADGCKAPKGASHLLHPVEFVVVVARGPSSPLDTAVRQAAALFEQAVRKEAAAEGVRLAARPAVMPTIEPLTSTLSSYNRVLLSRDEAQQPLQILLELRGRGAQGVQGGNYAARLVNWAREPLEALLPRDNPTLALSARIQLARPGEAARWQEQLDLLLTLATRDKPLQLIPDAQRGEVEQAARQVWAQLSEQLRCEPLSYEAVRMAEGRFKLMAGAHQGLRPGDRLVITDRNKVPRRLLEQGSVDHLALVEVERVMSDRAETRQIAGPTLASRGQWLALPF